MGKLNKFDQLVSSYADKKIDAVIIYVREVHAIDGASPFKKNYLQVKQAKTLQDRLSAAEFLTSKTPTPVYADSIRDTMAVDYAAVPERLYALYDGNVVYQGRIGPPGYDLDEFDNFIKNFADEKNL